MVMTKIWLLVSLLLLGGLLLSSPAIGQDVKTGVTSGPKPTPSPSYATLDRGRIEGSSYSNEQLGISFSAPATWTIMSEKELIAMREAAKALFRDETDPKLKANLEASVERTTALFNATKLAPGAPGDFNASLIFAVERIPTGIVQTPRDYYDLMLHSMALSESMKAGVLEPFQLKQIGTTPFGLYTLKITSNVGISLQKQLIAIKAPYAYGLFFTYYDDGDAAVFDEVLKTIKTK